MRDHSPPKISRALYGRPRRISLPTCSNAKSSTSVFSVKYVANKHAHTDEAGKAGAR